METAHGTGRRSNTKRNDIIQAVRGLLEERYPGEPVYENRLPPDFQRPSFLVEAARTETRDVNLALVQENVTVRVTCLGAEPGDGGAALNDRVDTVCGLFSGGLLKVGDRVARIASVTGPGEGPDPQATAVVSYVDSRPGYRDPGAQTAERYALQVKTDGKD